MPPLPNLTAAELAAFARKYGLQGTLERLPSVGIVNRVYRAALNGQAVVLRVPLPGDDRDALNEGVAAPAACRAGVRTPELLIFDDDREVLNAPVTVYAFAPGRSLDRCGWAEHDPRLLRAYREAGRELARLHASVSEVADPHGRLATIRAPNVSRTLARVTDGKKLGLPDATWATDTVFRLLETAPPPPPVFLHNDLHAGNLMVADNGADEGAVTALIDWGDAGWGDPALDLTYAGPLAAPGLLRGYREEAGRSDGGLALRLLAYLLEDATRRLAYVPETHETELWYTRPGTALMQLLRVSTQFPEWGEWLGSSVGPEKWPRSLQAPRLRPLRDAESPRTGGPCCHPGSR
ncbi:phosphotransferase family protein [Deinococcus arenicola]|uniref:Aminoglycoside phosphotransferase family protein n=1 Tax=Deinococcus arenicola TaxID=2994950 RepID=A0ABU4DUX5_9DEIO|nr:aminoglycoside phosphotransferase family protein [Deinococcus sp. ZS9-10]MDV6375757.1 aminoglycoside phosphotransferase family protein [Deinococcus sp. ZS9-10]